MGHEVDICIIWTMKVYHISNGLPLNNEALCYLTNTTSSDHNIYIFTCKYP